MRGSFPGHLSDATFEADQKRIPFYTSWHTTLTQGLKIIQVGEPPGMIPYKVDVDFPNRVDRYKWGVTWGG